MRPTTTTTTIERNEAILAEIFRLLLISSRMRMSQIPNGSHSSHFFFLLSSLSPSLTPSLQIPNLMQTATLMKTERHSFFLVEFDGLFFPLFLSFVWSPHFFLFPLVELKEKKERTWRIQQQHKSRRRLWESN